MIFLEKKSLKVDFIDFRLKNEADQTSSFWTFSARRILDDTLSPMALSQQKECHFKEN